MDKLFTFAGRVGEMGKRKIPMEFIENDSNRMVTYKKRQFGITKKVHEVSVLSGADVMVISFSPKGDLHVFSNQRYQFSTCIFLQVIKLGLKVFSLVLVYTLCSIDSRNISM